jgi:hypothetical protein
MPHLTMALYLLAGAIMAFGSLWLGSSGFIMGKG